MSYISHANCGWFHIQQAGPKANPFYVSPFTTIEIHARAPGEVCALVEDYFKQEVILADKLRPAPTPTP